MSANTSFEDYIQPVEDFPRPGIKFYDISPLLGSAAVFRETITAMAQPLAGKVDKLAACDARGFLFAGAMALQLGCGVVLLRKPGKLPGDVHRATYDLEYGSAELCLQKNSIHKGEHVALVDDVVATGGTARAGVELVRSCGGAINVVACVINLPHLGGSALLQKEGITVQSVICIGEN
jgi:adenine phosphoribosyltransferase